MLLVFDDSAALGAGLADALGRAVAGVEIHHFPDRESRVRVPPSLPERVIFCRSLDDPNAKLVELMLAAAGARDAGARHLTLVAPYLCYMRQDTAFSPGEVVSQRVIGAFLAGQFDALVTVDPHLHRTANLTDAVPAATTLAVCAAPVVGAFLRERCPDAVLLGPDAESRQWVSTAATAAGLDFAVAAKTRHDDRDVSIDLPERTWMGTHVVLVDDVASSGRTLAQTALALYAAGAARVDAVVTHALFAGDALAVVEAAGIRQLWSSDTIAHPSNAFSLAPTLADVLPVVAGGS